MIQAAPAFQSFVSDSLYPSPFSSYVSACQLHLTRLVQQFSAVAGWFIYHHSLLKQRQCLSAIQSIEKAPELVDLNHIDSEEFLIQLDREATPLGGDLWAFQYTPDEYPAEVLHGLKFRDVLSDHWAYLMFWQQRANLAMMAQQLQPEIEILKTCILLDQQQSYQHNQIQQYQQILQQIEHQLRNPLAVIHLYAANLYNSLDDEKDQDQAIAIRDAVQYLRDHLTDMIAGCQRTQVRAEVCHISALISEAWQGLHLMATAKQVQLKLPSRPLTVMGDRAQLLQVFENLLHNALCFSPPGGAITVQGHGFCQEVAISLADQGPGLSPSDLQHMFRPYYSNRSQGSGLGLHIVRQIIEEHGGKIWADNVHPHGAQFSIVLPQ